MSIALCMIVRDGIADGVERAIVSARPFVDEVCVWENSSTDGTPELLARLAAGPGAPIRVEHGAWADDFAAAREASFAMTEAEWIIHFDANDELIGGRDLGRIVERADKAGASIVWAAYDHMLDMFELSSRWFWWPRIVRRGSGRWRGRVHEHWYRDGVDRWRNGVGQPGSVYAHPARLRLFHHDRAPQPRLKYHRLLNLAADDPERTPRVFQALGNECAQVDDKRAVAYWEAYLERGCDCEGTPNGFHAETLHKIARAYDRLGKARAARRYWRKWELYSQRLTEMMARDPAALAFHLAMDDNATVTKWAAMAPTAAPLLIGPQTSRASGATRRMAIPSRR